MDSKRRIRFLALTCAFSFVATAVLASEPRITFDIPAGELAQTVIEFGKQSQTEILYFSMTSVEGIKTPEIKGELTISDALAEFLKGTGFGFEVNRNAIFLRRVDERGGSAVESRQPSGVVRAKEAARSQGDGSGQIEPKMEQVVVTGSYLHGVLDIMSPLEFVSRKELSEVPYATVQDALQSLPNNLISTQSENFSGVGNFIKGTAPNLRGLGYGATLVLVDGYRQPAAGTSADFVDISNIPWSAVDHIEVLPDGASALYGSDAIAGVVNVIMRDHVEGAETKLRSGFSPDGASETLLAQLFGHSWGSGKVLFAYQYSDRTALTAADRDYAASADKTEYGGRDFRTSNSNPGNILDPRTFAPAYAIPPNQDGRSLEFADLLPGVVNLQNQFATYDLSPDRQMHSVFLTASQKINGQTELFAESRYSQRKVSYPSFPYDQVLFVPSTNGFFHPFEGAPYVLVAYSFLNDLGPANNFGKTRSDMSTLGLKASFNNDWKATFSASYGEEDLEHVASNVPDQSALAKALADPHRSTAFNPFGDGSHTNPETLDQIRSTQIEDTRSSFESVSAIADGALFELPSGEAKLATGVEHRREALDRNEPFPGRFDRQINSAFAELSVPIVGDAANPHAIPRLELSLAGRYERYSDFGDTFNPKLGLRWAPLQWIKLRTSWGTSFKAPRLLDLYDASSNGTGILLFPDPHSSSGMSLVAVLQGNNPDLTQETATTWTAGLDFASQTLPGFALSLTYFDINYRNQVIQPGPTSPFDILLQDDLWASVITRSPTRDQVIAVCNRPDLFGVSRSECIASSPAAIVDLRLSNLASTTTQGFDVKFDYGVNSDFGKVSLGFRGTYLLDFERRLTSNAPSINVLDTVGNPLSLRARALMGWEGRAADGAQFGATANLNYVGDYRDTESPVRQTVGASTTFDLSLSYQTIESNDWAGGLKFTLTGTNLFNGDPPFVDRNFGYDVLNAVPYGRVVSVYIEKKW